MCQRQLIAVMASTTFSIMAQENELCLVQVILEESLILSNKTFLVVEVWEENHDVGSK
jgi:hypothetical protein